MEQKQDQTGLADAHARLEAALRTAEEKYRLLLDSIDESFVVIEMIDGEADTPVDWRYLEANAAFERQTGLAVADRTARELMPNLEPFWFETFDKVLRTGKPARFERCIEDLDRWFNVYAFRVGDEGSRQITALFNDVTGRKNTEATLRQREERERFLLRLSDALRPLGDAADVKGAACALLGRQLHANRVHYLDVAGNDGFVAEPGYADGVAPLTDATASQWDKALRGAFRNNGTISCDDVRADPRLSPSERARLLAADIAAFVAVMLVKDGRRIAVFGVHNKEPRHWTQAEVQLIRDVAERIRETAKRARAEAALGTSEKRYRALIDQAIIGFSETDLTGKYLSVNDCYCKIIGYAREELLNGMRVQDITDPRDLPANLVQFERLAKGGPGFEIEKRFLRKDGTPIWVHNGVYALTGDDGKPQVLAAIVLDINERKLAEGHHNLLLNELNHRVKNTLATVQSIALQTFGGSLANTEAVWAFESRLMALAKAHDLLTRHNWRSVALHDLLVRELAPFFGEASDRLGIEGENVDLRPKVALVLAMAVHELATNAVKYGALSRPGGKVRIVSDSLDGNGPRLRIVWMESGGPGVKKPDHHGFGLRLVGRGLAYELNGRVHMDYDPGGIVCTMEIPLTAQENGDGDDVR